MDENLKVKIGKLLNQAEQASTDGERDAFYEKAFKLSTSHSIELAEARASVAKLEQREQPTMKTVDIGERGQHNLAVFCELFMSIGRSHDIKFNISSKSTYVIAFGMPSDIELTETLYETILPQMMQAANDFVRTGDWKHETTYRNGKHGWGHYPVDSRVVKRNFYETFTRVIANRMRTARAEARLEAVEATRAADTDEAAAEAGQTSTDLVLADKELEIRDFYSEKSTARGSWKGSTNTYTSSAGRRGGAEAGKRASLSGTRSLPGGRKAIG